MDKDRARIVMRRKITGYSSFVDSNFTLNLMMGFIATNVTRKSDTLLDFVIEQSNDKEHRDLKDVKISSKKADIDFLLSEIEKKAGNPTDTPKIISYDYEEYPKIMPVVYQPNVDAWKNILREIQVSKEKCSYNATLVFEDENLRRFGIFDFIYRIYRFFRFHRTVDIESFEICGDELVFDKTYSGKHILFDDNIHESATVPIKYYFQDKNHPVVFVNTANHTFADSDNNHDFWKREYVPWSKDVPVKYGDLNREDTEKQYKRF